MECSGLILEQCIILSTFEAFEEQLKTWPQPRQRKIVKCHYSPAVCQNTCMEGITANLRTMALARPRQCLPYESSRGSSAGSYA